MALYGQAALDTANRQLAAYEAVVDPGALASETDVSAATLRVRFVCIVDYSTLSVTDQVWFDQAVGAYTAIKLISSLAASAAEGLSVSKDGDHETRFMAPTSDQQALLYKFLHDSIGYLSCVRKMRRSIAADINVIAVGGATRSREATGRYSLPRLVASLLPSGWGGDRRVALPNFGDVYP